MPAPVLRSQLVTFARQAAGFDVIGTSPDEFINDPEATGMVDRAVHELYDLLVQARGEEYYVKEFSFFVDPLAPEPTLWDLPQDFYQLLTVYIQSPAFLGFLVIVPFMEREVAVLKTQSLIGTYYPQMTRYRLRGEQAVSGTPPVTVPSALIEFLPTPIVGFTAFVRYLPVCTRAAVGPTIASPDIFYDGINGWEDFVIYTVAAKMVIKEERDPAPYLAMRAAAEQRIRTLAGQRNAGEPEHVVDTRGWLRRSAMGRVGGIRTRLWYP